MTSRLKLAAAVLVFLLARATAAAEPAAQHVETSEVRLMCVPPVPAVKCIELQPGHFVDGATWGKLDAGLKASQDQVTRLTAENTSLRASAASWSPGWKSLTGAVLTGLALGLYLDHKL